MKQMISVTLLLAFLLFSSCRGGQECTFTGLTPGQDYNYMYFDSEGNLQSGNFTPTSSTIVISGIDNNIACGDVSVERLFLMEYSMV